MMRSPDVHSHLREAFCDTVWPGHKIAEVHKWRRLREEVQRMLESEAYSWWCRMGKHPNQNGPRNFPGAVSTIAEDGTGTHRAEAGTASSPPMPDSSSRLLQHVLDVTSQERPSTPGSGTISLPPSPSSSTVVGPLWTSSRRPILATPPVRGTAPENPPTVSRRVRFGRVEKGNRRQGRGHPAAALGSPIHFR